jgi:hypothetical protein
MNTTSGTASDSSRKFQPNIQYFTATFPLTYKIPLPYTQTVENEISDPLGFDSGQQLRSNVVDLRV